jgi:hypothetical protein
MAPVVKGGAASSASSFTYEPSIDFELAWQ